MNPVIEHWLVQFYILRGQRALHQRDYKRALRWYEKAFLRSADEHNRFYMALCHMSLTNYETAHALLEEVLKVHSDQEMVVLTMAECCFQLQNWEQATELFQQLVNRFPNHTSYRTYLQRVTDPVLREQYLLSQQHYKAGLDAWDAKQYTKAEEELRQAIYYDENLALAHHALGMLHFTKKKSLAQILPHIEKAITLEPENEQFKKSLLYVRNKFHH